jgi:predicted nucleotide-binding protein
MERSGRFIRRGREEDREEHMTKIPHAFLCYGIEDMALAEKLALAMQSHGIETWWDKWCIRPGDSLRQKVEEGLGNCTHFIALLTPTSINNPGLTRKWMQVSYGRAAGYRQ